MFVCINGEPASGKSLLVKSLVAVSDSWTYNKFKSLRFMLNKSLKIVVFGAYGEGFMLPGIDGLPLSAIKDLERFVKKFYFKNDRYSFLAEGNRMNSVTVLDFITGQNMHVKLLNMHVSKEERRLRMIKSNKQYTEKFLRECKVNNDTIVNSYPFERLENENELNAKDNLSYLKSLLNIDKRVKLKKGVL